MTFKVFEDIDAWKKSRILCNDIYKITKNISDDNSLKDQMLRSSGSVMDNIAEGFDRGGKKEFIQFLFISKSSCSETRSQLYRALDREYINSKTHSLLYNQCIEISKMISGLIKYLKKTEIEDYKASNI